MSERSVGGRAGKARRIEGCEDGGLLCHQTSVRWTVHQHWRTTVVELLANAPSREHLPNLEHFDEKFWLGGARPGAGGSPAESAVPYIGRYREPHCCPGVPTARSRRSCNIGRTICKERENASAAKRAVVSPGQHCGSNRTVVRGLVSLAPQALVFYRFHM